MLMISEKLKDSEDSKMSSPFTEEEIHILKKICDNPIFKTQKTFHINKNSTLTELRSAVCNDYDISIELFTSRRKDASLIKARIEFVKQAIKIKNADTSKIADFINKDRQMVSYYLRKIKNAKTY
jgi:chromosomal replication initiation ATPase DnaA|tara:strand:+ start:137 stop:511 length:375 start_codon:yes stop_codon:yes gene_type:complete